MKICIRPLDPFDEKIIHTTTNAVGAVGTGTIVYFGTSTVINGSRA